MRSKFFVVVLFLTLSTVAMAQTTGKDAFLGVWTLKDNSAHIEIIKSEGNYYIIEFAHVKHELFFSGDERRVMFYEWGKGPSGPIGRACNKVCVNGHKVIVLKRSKLWPTEHRKRKMRSTKCSTASTFMA